MPKSSTGGLKGGRALYRGPNSYASQGFENDTRQSQLGGLAILYLWGDQTIPTGLVDTTVPFSANYLSKSFQSAFTRNFILKDSALHCRKGGTYRFDASVRTSALSTGNILVLRVKIQRGVNLIEFADAAQNPAPVADYAFTVHTSGVVDLLSGDIVSLTAATDDAGGVTITGGSLGTTPQGGVSENVQPTFLILEQIDLPAPA